MSSIGAGLRVRRSSAGEPGRTRRFYGILSELMEYLLKTPLVAVIVLWIVNLPLLVLFLYGDIVKSVETLAGMTITFVIFLLTFITVLLSAVYAIAFVGYRRKKSREDPAKKWRYA